MKIASLAIESVVLLLEVDQVLFFAISGYLGGDSIPFLLLLSLVGGQVDQDRTDHGFVVVRLEFDFLVDMGSVLGPEPFENPLFLHDSGGQAFHFLLLQRVVLSNELLDVLHRSHPDIQILVHIVNKFSRPILPNFFRDIKVPRQVLWR